MKRALAILLAGLLWPSISVAWEKSCNGTDQSTLSLSPGDYTCWTFDADADVSGYLHVHACENVDLFYNSDTLGTTTTTTVDIWTCFARNSAASTSNCNNVKTLDGNITNSDHEMLGYSAVWLVADALNHETSDVPVLIVKCNGPQGPN